MFPGLILGSQLQWPPSAQPPSRPAEVMFQILGDKGGVKESSFPSRPLEDLNKRSLPTSESPRKHA